MKMNTIQNKNMSDMTILPYVIVMVGLPARGKTYMSKKLSRYLNWIGITTKVFNIGEYRRRKSGESTALNDFFDPTNEKAVEIRDTCATSAVIDAINWLSDDGQVAIVDGTNTSKRRRQTILNICQEKGNFKVFFIESLCENLDIIKANILIKMSTPCYYSSIIGIDRNNYFRLLKDPSFAQELETGPIEISCEDYINKNPSEAIIDFKKRIDHYASIYEPLDEENEKHLSFMKIFNQGDKFLMNKIHGHLQSRVVYFLMNIRVSPRTIYLSRHGESEFNLQGRIGGDSDLSLRGQQYAKQLGDYFSSPNINNLKIWTSLKKRTIQTVHHFDYHKEHWKSLNEIDAGDCEELTYEEIALKYPKEFARRDADKLRYRYYGGESYQDLISRLESVIMELENQENILIICHQAVARCLLGYFLDIDATKIPYVKVPLHTVVKLTPMVYGCQKELIPFNVPAVDTHRSKSQNVSTLRSFEDVLETIPYHPL